MIKYYKGELNLCFEDVNTLLTRAHFTKHDTTNVHYSRGDKEQLVRTACCHEDALRIPLFLQMIHYFKASGKVN